MLATANAPVAWGQHWHRCLNAFAGLFSQCFDWTADAGALEAALAWKPDLIYVHKLDELDILAGIVASAVPKVRMVHDHHMYCARGYRYMPWNRKPCTRTAGWGCLTTCGVVRNRDGMLPLKVAWPGKKLRELELCRQFDHHFVVTNFMRDELVQHGFDANAISIMPPVPRAAPVDFVADYNDKEIVYVGQIIRGKGVDAMIHSLAHIQHEDWKCRIIGVGPHMEYCQQLTKKLGLSDKVTFAGWIQQDELRHAYAHARCAVVPSLWPEPIATVGLEFMHHALPVVAFDAGGIRDWCADNEIGFLVPWNDQKAMGQRLEQLIGDQAMAARFGQEGQRRAQSHYQYERYLDDMAFMFSELAERKDAA